MVDMSMKKLLAVIQNDGWEVKGSNLSILKSEYNSDGDPVYHMINVFYPEMDIIIFEYSLPIVKDLGQSSRLYLDELGRQLLQRNIEVELHEPTAIRIVWTVPYIGLNRASIYYPDSLFDDIKEYWVDSKVLLSSITLGLDECQSGKKEFMSDAEPSYFVTLNLFGAFPAEPQHDT